MRATRFTLAMVGVTLCATMATIAMADQTGTAGLRVGWAMTDITPDRPVLMPGFHGKRISGGVRDRLTATVLALEKIGSSGDVAEQAIMVSCDLIATWRTTQDSVKKLIKDRLPDFDSDKLFLNATHTHQGALARSEVFKGVLV